MPHQKNLFTSLRNANCGHKTVFWLSTFGKCFTVNRQHFRGGQALNTLSFFTFTMFAAFSVLLARQVLQGRTLAYRYSH